jgi:uncharacterized protein
VSDRPEPAPAPGPPPGLRYIDVHVHLHPEGLATATQRYFARENWHNAHPFDPAVVATTLAARGVERFCFFSYAHKPGIARSINRWVAETAARLPGSVPLGTLHVDDTDLAGLTREATDELGLIGFKFHHSVQRFHVDDARLVALYERAEAEGLVFMLHIGTMPYRDPFTGAAHLERVLERFPQLRVCVAHLGAFETERFLGLAERFPHVYLDTTMALTPLATPYVGADPDAVSNAQLVRYQDRIMLGSDFPLIPYDYDEERSWAWKRGLPVEVQRKIFYDNAARFLRLAPDARR